MEAGGDEELLRTVRAACEEDAGAGRLRTKNSLYLERGPYDIAAVMDEGEDMSGLRIRGPVIDLLDPLLPVLSEKTVTPGQEAFLYDLTRPGPRQAPAVLCAASRIYDEKMEAATYSFVARGPAGTHNVMRVLLPGEPSGVSATHADGSPAGDLGASWDSGSRTLLIDRENGPDGIHVMLKW